LKEEMPGRSPWFLSGLFITTLTSLLVELLNTRLLSVITWYHLSFFAVSTAMFGMSAGAVRVYLGGARFEGAYAVGQLARNTTLLSLSIPISHIIVLFIPIRVEWDATSVASLAAITIAMAVPFYLSGVLVAIALTRIPGPTGLPESYACSCSFDWMPSALRPSGPRCSRSFWLRTVRRSHPGWRETTESSGGIQCSRPTGPSPCGSGIIRTGRDTC
jgi:hypothetical protein